MCEVQNEWYFYFLYMVRCVTQQAQINGWLDCSKAVMRVLIDDEGYVEKKNTKKRAIL
jgi:hypothetical protein